MALVNRPSAELQGHGHEVTALVRDDAQADIVAARGATPAVADLYDRSVIAGLLGNADGAIHTASPGDATSADLDSAVVDAATSAFDGTGKPYLQVGGLWVYGANSSISEASVFNAPALVSWKEPIERRVLGASGMRGAVIVSSVAYGDGVGGIPGLLLGSPRDSAGNLIMLGTGQQHWSTVHAADLADFFRRVLEDVQLLRLDEHHAGPDGGLPRLRLRREVVGRRQLRHVQARLTIINVDYPRPGRADCSHVNWPKHSKQHECHERYQRCRRRGTAGPERRGGHRDRDRRRPGQ
jgi:uncharacterized protein YbjT (DUF2867 family)